MRIAGPCPAEPFQLVLAHLGLSPAGSFQLWYTNLRIATEARPTRNTLVVSKPGMYARTTFCSSIKPRLKRHQGSPPSFLYLLLHFPSICQTPLVYTRFLATRHISVRSQSRSDCEEQWQIPCGWQYLGMTVGHRGCFV
jgi:hypothetical protein